MKIWSKIAVCCLWWFATSICTIGQVWAVMDIEIVQGRGNKVSIMVEDFSNQQQYPDRFKQYLSEIIRADLKNSGHFLLVKTVYGKLIPRLRGSIKPIGQRLEVSYQLITGGDKTDQVGGNNSQTRILLSGVYKVAPNQIRKVAHRISNDIYQQIIGRPGVFETKLAYVLVNGKGRDKTYSIVVSDYDGFDTQTLLQSSAPIMSLSWSPDGKKLAYVSFEGHRSAIYIQDLESGRREVVSKLPGINGAPSWSPDGTKLALVLTTSGYPKIHMLDLTSKRLTQLTHDWYLDTEPNWAPDGRSLVFTSDRSGAPQIYRLELGNGQVERVTYQGSYNARASFGGHGHHIVFLHRNQGLFTVATQAINERKLRVLATVGASGEAPTISPNGEMVVFVRNQHGRGTLSVISIDGERGMILPGIQGEIRDPAWSAY